MKKVKSDLCLGCNENKSENLNHILLQCSHYNAIREIYLPQFVKKNKKLSEILDSEDMLILSILDPLSSKLPESVTKNWDSAKDVYKISRQFCWNVHKKREKLYKDFDK